MEIYRLKDDIEKSGKIFRVTDLRQGVKNPDRVNVYVNSKFAFSLDVAQVVDLGVKVGLVLSEERLAELKKASEFGKAYQRALEWVLVRPRSERELRDYLKRREKMAEVKEKQREWMAERENKPIRKCERAKYDFDDLIVERLCTRGYVNDRKFAGYYVENRFVKKGVSRKRLKMELMKKGVAKEIVDEVLSGRNDEEEILKIINKKRAKYNDPDKLVGYLCRQGFSYDLVQEVVNKSEY